MLILITIILTLRHREIVEAVQRVYSGKYGVLFFPSPIDWILFNSTKSFSSHFMSAGSEVVVENAHIIIRRLIALVSYPHMMVRL